MPDTREFSVKTPLPEDALLFSHMTGHDAVSACFDFDLCLLSRDFDIAATDLLGLGMTVRIGRDAGVRCLHGLVDSLSLGKIAEGYLQFQARLRPWLWLLSKTYDNRIFQNQSVIEIIEDVFSAYPQARFEKRLQATYAPRDYCVQYAESDLNFVQRLMAHEGIFYFFEFEEGAHTLVLVDTLSALKPAPEFEEVGFQPDTLATFRDGDFITRWAREAVVTTGAYVQTDYDLKKPSADLMTKSTGANGHEADGFERYHYPGHYTELARGDDLAAIRMDELRSPWQRVRASGSVRGLFSGCTFKLTDFPRAAENAEYAVLRADYTMWDDQYVAGLDRAGEGFEVQLLLTPSDVAYRPERTAQHPRMPGPQTAVVVGPSGEEIFTDEFSRVKVQFHWDRLGGDDEKSSCFVRVSSVWAGAGWGFIQIPRIGQEVIVDFLEGDPDQPIITGRVYNANQMPPYGLPGNATQSGWKSNSSPGGGGWNELRFEDKAGSEEVYFQAQKDHTELVKNDEGRTIGHDFSEDVGNDAQQSVGHDRTESVGNDKSTSVGNNRTVDIGVNDTETVGSNRSLKVGSNETISIGSNSTETIGIAHTQTVGAVQTITVGAARVDSVAAAETRSVGAVQSNSIGLSRSVDVGTSQSHSVGAADDWKIGAAQSVDIGAAQTIKIGAGQTLNVAADQSSEIGGARIVKVAKAQLHDVAEDAALKSGKSVMIEAADSIVLKCGSAAISMKKDGTIMIEGKDITLKGSGKINFDASSEITGKGSKINLN